MNVCQGDVTANRGEIKACKQARKACKAPAESIRESSPSSRDALRSFWKDPVYARDVSKMPREPLLAPPEPNRR
jgi:hypothetical protein